MSDDIRNRFRSASQQRASTTSEDDTGSDIFAIWKEQKKMRAEDQKLARELAEAKQKAKQLKKTLRKHQIDEGSEQVFQQVGQAKDLLEVKVKLLQKKVLENRKRSAIIASASLVLVIASLVYIVRPDNNQKDTLGDSTNVASGTLPQEQPAFDLLYPQGSDESAYDTVRISPNGAAPSYTYLDRFTDDGQIFRVTQQEVPANFDLASVAKDFQATSVIQIDELIVYHGYSEQGGVQSLIFEKDGKLVSIRSSQKFSDDEWASYILSLQ